MNCIIIDDHRKSAFQLQMLLHANGFSNVFVATKPCYVDTLLRENNIAVIFVRVKLWSYRFLRTAETLIQPPPVVFVSSEKDKYKEDLYGQVDYHISAPYSPEKIQRILKKLERERIISDLKFLFIQRDRRYLKLAFESIELVEGKTGNYVAIYTANEKHMAVGSLNVFMQKLPENLFTRISDQFIIPQKDKCKINNDAFPYEGRELKLTYKYLRRSQKKNIIVLGVSQVV